MVINIKLCPIPYKNSKFTRYTIYDSIMFNDTMKIDLCLRNCAFVISKLITEKKKLEKGCEVLVGFTFVQFVN